MNFINIQYNRGYQYLLQEKYIEAISFYEEAINTNPTEITNYWYLGLAYLLQGNEEEAQATWLFSTAEVDEEQLAQYSSDLFQVLQAEALRQEELENYQLAWVVRHHACEFVPDDINNLLQIVWLSIKYLDNFVFENLSELRIVELLELEQLPNIDRDLLLKVLEQVLDKLYIAPIILRFVKACSHHVPSLQNYIDIVIAAALSFSFIKHQPHIAIALTEICLELDSENIQLWRNLVNFYQNSGNYSKGIEISKYYQSLCKSLTEQTHAAYLTLRGFLTAGGYWEEAAETFDDYYSLLSKLANSQETQYKGLPLETNVRLFNTAFFLPYLQDEPRTNRWIQNRLSSIASNNLQEFVKEREENFYPAVAIDSPKTIKIGFASHCFRQHSVGWLSRWVFQHYDREKFQVYLYFHANEPENAFAQEWFIKNAWQAHSSTSSLRLAEQVYEDKIDILVDLDSITLDTTCELMALKPAPIQVTWLGWDASGVPGIDYYIADPYVLPDNAQDYYQEKIWRLPQTYVAVDGFEVGVPTLRRDDLDIPTDAIVYASAQRGYKRHLDTARLQMEILKQVPNSYFVIKGLGDKVSIQQFFTQLAEEEGIDPNRLRFPPLDINEFVHRANLGIADVVLDTYPYNGATTTLETLWMGIPLVTRVGQQFAARNSYAFLKNVGVEEGIAWTDEEYIEWGVRLGKDEALRQQVAWKLKASRQTSPLWNAKQFTREMETAFQQMWQKYVEARS